MNPDEEIFTFWEEFLPPEELESLRSEIMALEDQFSPTTIVQGDKPETRSTSVRRSRFLSNVKAQHIADKIKPKILAALPDVLSALTLPVLSPTRVSVQVTSTGDRGFYKPHVDNSVHDKNRRVVSFVYFCNPYPQGFQKGELLIYATRNHADFGNPELKVFTVTPGQGSIVFFKSDFLHEISLVECPSDILKDTRLTINGWIYF
jgi:SM-20-related protein